MQESSHAIVVVGASAGGIEALTNLLQRLPSDFQGSVLVALHGTGGESRLPDILTRKARLPAEHVRDHTLPQASRIYVARPNQHLVIEHGVLRSVPGPRRNGHRPSINLLFESAAREFGSQAIGIILSGALDDGSLGLIKIKQAGGIAVVQDPEDATFSGMPESAMNSVDVDFCGTARDIAGELVRLANSRTRTEVAPVYQGNDEPLRNDNSQSSAAESGSDRVAGFSCPECGGVLSEERVGDVTRYRCHVGHEVTERALLQAQGEQVEKAMWIALRVLEEREHLVSRAMERARQRGHMNLYQYFQSQNEEARRSAATIRNILLGDNHNRSITALQEEFDHTVRDDGPSTLDASSRESSAH